MKYLKTPEASDRLNRIENVEVNVCVVKNQFFGGDIHIAGLLTATDISAQLRAFPDCRQTIYLPKICAGKSPPACQGPRWYAWECV